MPKRKVAIISDTTAYLPPELVARYQIGIVPLKVHWGTDTFLDGIDLSPAEFCARIKTDRNTPTTAAPSLGEFQAAFTQAAETAEAIISIHISSQLSATASVAAQAKALLPQIPIEVVDSLFAGMAHGFVVLAAARAVEQGGGLAEAVQAAQLAIRSTTLMILPDTLEYLRRGGRIGGAQALLGHLMDIKPILYVRAGRIEVLERARTKKKAQERLIELALEHARQRSPVRLAVLHADARAEAQALLDRLAAQLSTAEKMVCDLSPVIATHVGPGTLGLVVCAGI